LTEADRNVLSGEIGRLAREKVFVLAEGEIEDYLPPGIGKDMSKLIESLSSSEFCDLMPAAGRAELESIIRHSVQ
jgi:hypothetical protein